MRIHIVQKGDTLWKIAKKYGVNFEELKKANSHLSNPDLIMPGMKIKVPISGGTVKKKEAPIGIKKEAQVGIPKEQPIKEKPKQKTEPLPAAEQPKLQPKAPKEVPMVPFTPIMPQQTHPGVDVSNYYMLNLANLSMQQQPPQLPPQPQIQPQVQPQMQPKPQIHVPPQPLPTPKPIVMEEMIESSESVEIPEPPTPPMTSVPMQACMFYPSLFQCPKCCTPITPIMPGSGFFHPQVQAMLPMMVGGASQMPFGQFPTTTFPLAPMVPGMVGEEVAEVESSSFFETFGQMPGTGMGNIQSAGVASLGLQPSTSTGKDPVLQPTASKTGSKGHLHPKKALLSGQTKGQSLGTSTKGKQVGGFAPGTTAPSLGTGALPGFMPGTTPQGTGALPGFMPGTTPQGTGALPGFMPGTTPQGTSALPGFMSGTTPQGTGALLGFAPGAVTQGTGMAPSFMPGTLNPNMGMTPGFVPGTITQGAGTMPGFMPGAMIPGCGTQPGVQPPFLPGIAAPTTPSFGGIPAQQSLLQMSGFAPGMFPSGLVFGREGQEQEERNKTNEETSRGATTKGQSESSSYQAGASEESGE